MMLTKILVVDDSASDLLIIENLLSEYSILTACDGIEAMRQIEDHQDIELVILDLNMPNMDGFQVLEILKSDHRYKKLRTIILTNYDELDNEIKGLKLGAVDYIRKPIHMDSLKVRIDIHAELLRIQHLLEQKVYEQGITFDTILDQAPIGIAVSHSIDPLDFNSDVITSINPLFEQIIGRSKEELIKWGWAKITHPDDVEEDMRNFKRLQSGEIKSYAMEKRYIKPDGSIVWVHMIVAPLMLVNDHQYNYICLVQDITGRRVIENALVESERSKSVLLSHLPGLAYRCNYNREWTMQFVSAGCFELTGYHPERLLYNKDLSFHDLIAPEYRRPLWEEWKRILAKQLPFKYEYEIITAGGERKWVLEMGQGIFSEQGEVEALEGIILDISDRKEMENTLRYHSEHENFTGLYNRRHLEKLLKNDAKKRASEKRALVSINLTALQSLTANYGFQYTQIFVKRIVDSLIVFSKEKCLLLNTYDNGFVFYLKDYKDKYELIEFCETVASTLELFLMAERIKSGIGVIEIDKDNELDTDQLLKNLLIASERALNINDKELGICFYDMEIEMQIFREQEIKRELSQIASDENKDCLYLQYQPILNLKSNQVCGFEALARLNSQKLGQVPPLEFIPIAEKTKLIIPLGNIIIRQALRFLNKLRDYGYGTINVSINVSVTQLMKNDFCRNLFQMINEMKVNPENFGIEITESVFTSDYEYINHILGELKGAGLHIAIDDFGTGYSSLAKERELNIDSLKIDKYFIDDLLDHQLDKAITGDIVSMAHKLNHITIAEGVEYEIQKHYLLKCECDEIQGFLISKPLDEDAAIEFLHNQTINNNHAIQMP